MSNTNIIRAWIQSQPYLYFPITMEDHVIERFLCVYDNDINKTKEVLQLFFKFRAETPEFFTNRDPLSENLKNILDVVCILPLPRKTNEGYQVLFTCFADSNLEKFDVVDYAKLYFNVLDIRIKTEENVPPGDITIFDFTGLTFKHLMKFISSMGVVKKYMKITQEARAVTLKQIHFINNTGVMDKLLTLLKPFMKEDVKRMIHFHTKGSDTLFQYVSQDIIPVEFGGNGTSINEVKEYWRKTMEQHRDWLIENPWRKDIQNSECITHK